MNKRKHPKGSQFNVRVTPVEHARIKSKADERNQSVSQYVREILDFVIRPTVEEKS